MRRQLVLGALWVAFWIGLAWAVSPVLDQLDAHSPQSWTVPPSAITPITGEQQPFRAVSSAADSASARADVIATATAASPRPARTLVPAATSGRVSPPSPTHSLAELVRSGIASTYGPGFGEAWVAIPQGPGWRIRVCGPGACRVLVSTDKGPDQRLHPDRVVDLPVGAFEAVSGQPWRRGLTTVTVTILGRAW